MPRRTELYKEFKSIEVSNAIDLIIEQSNKTEIIVADDNLQKNITTVKMAYLLYPVIIIPL
jgi:predicted dinucleotide-utilizing enzyme